MKKLLYSVTAGMVMVTLTLVFGQWAAAASSDTKPPAVEITIDNLSFTPQTVTVQAGAEVRWRNRDDIPHTVVASDSAFKSKALDTDEQFSFTPTKPGTYSYFCSIHPKMTAKLVVQ